MKYILDCETRPNPKLTEIFDEFNNAPAKVIKAEGEEDWARKKQSVDPDYAEIACIGLKPLGKDPKIVTLKEMEVIFEDHSYMYPISEDVFEKKCNIEFITFNGKGFDIPLLIKQGIKNNLKFPYKHLLSMTNKWKNDHHTDLMDLLGEYGKYKSLDHYLGIYLGIRKETVGDEFFKNATQEDLEKHLLDDLNQTEKLYNLFERML